MCNYEMCKTSEVMVIESKHDPMNSGSFDGWLFYFTKLGNVVKADTSQETLWGASAELTTL